MTKPKPGAKNGGDGRPIGRPKLPAVNAFTERKQVVFIEELRKGQTMTGAAARAGISPQTVYLHMSKRPDFLDKVTRARDEGEAALIDAVTKAAHTGDTVRAPGGQVTIKPGDWRAAAWLLEHHPHTRERFAELSRVRLGGEPGGVPVQLQQEIQVGPATADRVRAVLTILAKAGQLPGGVRLLDGGGETLAGDEQEGTA